jgi:hypothetical protein
MAGALLAGLGLCARAWAAGTIKKDESLATRGPYAYVRHPLYLGSFLIGAGLATAGGHWAWIALVVAFFIVMYAPTVRQESEWLTELFGHRYVRYAARVPALLPRLRPYEASAEAGMLAWMPDAAPMGEEARREGGFDWRLYARNREWEALLGTLAAFAVLALRMRGP